MSQQKQIGEALTIAWRDPAEKDGPVHDLILFNIRPDYAVATCEAVTSCGYRPPILPIIHPTHEEITCSPCLTALALGEVDRILSREPVTV